MPPNDVIFTGWCDGGPLAGKRLAHPASRYRLTVRERTPDDVKDAVAALAKQHGVWIEVEDYRLIEGVYVFDEGAWRWTKS